MAREVLFKLRVDNSGLAKLTKFEKKMRSIKNETHLMGKAFGVFGKTVVKTFRKVGEATIEGLKDSLKAFEDFEFGMARIAKVSGSSIKDLEGLGKALREAVIIDLRGLTTLNELQRIAEISAKMGIPTEQLAKFSTTVAQVSKVWKTNAEVTARSLSRLQGQFSLSVEQLQNLASGISKAGDSFEISEKQLIDFAERVGGTAAITGQSIDQILAVGGIALTRSGLQARAAGTAFNKIFDDMMSDTQEFATFMGVRVGELARLLEEDGSKALELFAKQLIEIRDMEGPIAFNNAMTELIGNNTRVKQFMRSIVLNFDLMAEKGKGITEETKKGTRALKAYGAIADTLTGHLATLGALFHDIALTIGTVFGPHLNNLLEHGVIPLIKSFQEWIQEEENIIALTRLSAEVFEWLGLKVIDVKNLFEKFKEDVKEKGVWQAFQNLGVGAFNMIKTSIEDAIKPLTDFVRWVEDVARTAQFFYEEMTRHREDVVLAFETWIRVFEYFERKFTAMVSDIKEFLGWFEPVIKRIKELFGGGAEDVIGPLQPLADAILVAKNAEGEFNQELTKTIESMREMQGVAWKNSLYPEIFEWLKKVKGGQEEFTGLVQNTSRALALQQTLLGSGTDPASGMQQIQGLRHAEFRAHQQQQQSRSRFFQPSQETSDSPTTNITNITFQGNNVVDENTLGSFVRKITEVQNQQQGRIFGALA